MKKDYLLWRIDTKNMTNSILACKKGKIKFVAIRRFPAIAAFKLYDFQSAYGSQDNLPHSKSHFWVSKTLYVFLMISKE